MKDTPITARVVRAMTSDNLIRLSAMDSTPLWDGVRRGHPHLEADACATLVELISSAALMQSRTLLTERIQLILRSAGRAKAIVADSWPDGSLRGILDLNTESIATQWVAYPGHLQVVRSKFSGQPYIGNLELVDGGISAQLEHYLQQSEQIQACATLWCEPHEGRAGGLIVEPLPNCPPERLRRMLDALDGLDVTQLWERSPDFLVQWINQGDGAQIMSSLTLEYRCRCSRESLIDTLSVMPPEQLCEIFAENKPVEILCEYCGKSYSIAREHLADATVCNTQDAMHNEYVANGGVSE